MSSPEEQTVEELIARIRTGDEAAMGQLLNATYNDLRHIAMGLFGGESAGHTLQPTALVNEVCMKLISAPKGGWTDGKHFFRLAARAMRNLLTDHARIRNADKRGGGVTRVALDGVALAAPSTTIDLLALDEAITKLSKYEERLAVVFELRFLAGLTVEQTALVAEISPRAVEQDCRFIRTWLHKELVP
jgi:hypothetical protein